MFLEIRFARSKAFQRFIFLVQGLAIFMVLQSDLAYYWQILAVALLVYQGYGWLKNPYPNRPFESLLYKNKTWHLFEKPDRETLYHRARLKLDTRFFLILSLSTEWEKKDLLLFLDQFSVEDYHQIKRLMKMKLKK